MQADSTKKLQKYAIPKNVGIVFLERRKGVVEGLRKSKPSNSESHTDYRKIDIEHETGLAEKEKDDELSLDFDQDACAFLLLQLNYYQNIFEFQVVRTDMIPNETDDKHILFHWLADFASKHSGLGIDYWMGITKERVPQHVTWHFDSRMPGEIEVGGKSYMLWIITSRSWEKYRSPPSLFEYLLVTVFRCAIESLSSDLGNEELEKEFLSHLGHIQVTRGCMFDFTHRRASVSIFRMCLGCENKLRSLEKLIRDKGNKSDVNLVDDVNRILSKEWMGTPEKRDSPLFNLKKMYKYDVDRNSGFNKGLWEKFRDSISDNLAQWTVGTVIAGFVTIILTIIGLFFKH